MNDTIGAHARACSSDHSPVSWGLIRPSGTTEVASAITSAAPPRARPPRWTRCQGVGTPLWSSTEYWHMGETMIRLRRWVPRRSSGANRWVMAVTLPAQPAPAAAPDAAPEGQEPENRTMPAGQNTRNSGLMIASGRWRPAPAMLDARSSRLLSVSAL